MSHQAIKSSIFFIGLLFLIPFMSAEAADVYTQTFESSTGNWTQTVGTTDLTVANNQLQISNTTQGTSLESIAIAADSPSYQNGEAKLSFYYEGQKNFSLIFRGSETDKSHWQTVAYNGDGKWTVGQPGGKWLDNLSGPTLVEGVTYRLLVVYEGKKLTVYLNEQPFYQNEQVSYPDKTTINDDWSGKLGIRLFGNRSTLKVNSLKSGPIGSLQPSPETSQEFTTMRTRWRTNLVGDFNQYPELQSDVEVAAYIRKLSDEATQLYNTIDKSENRTTLWEKIPSDTNSANLTTQFKKLNTLAKAYGTKGTALYQNSDVSATISAGLDFMTETGRYSGKTYFGNWWDWQIGVTQEFIPTLMILYDDLSQEQIIRYVSIMSAYLPNPYQQLQGQAQTASAEIKFIANFKNSGANRTDQALSVLGLALLTEDSSKVYEAVGSIGEVFETVTKGDGFYADGSFIQHNDIPYSGSYGNVLIKGVGKLFSIVAGTRWQPENQTQTDFVETVKSAFIPLIVNGETMSFVNGRSIARAPASTKNGFGSATLFNLLISAEFADGTSKQELRQTAKYWMVQNLDYYLTNTRDFKDLLLTKEVMADATIDTTKKPFIGSHMYGSMDRFVFSDPKVSLGISMYSTRTSAFEAINKENKKGWHTADGMVYLYNRDGQFGNSYWPTVDWYRLPGTTVDTRALADETTFKSYRSAESFVGGTTEGEKAVIAMQLNKVGSLNAGQTIDMNTSAKKSWFVLDGKIIALGADINGISTSGIETIIDNRMLDSTSTYQFVNQAGQDVSTNISKETTASDWFLLKSSKEDQTIGYMMLDNQKVSTKQEHRSGTYKEINDAFPSDTLYTETYQKIIVEHGKQVTDGIYAYVTLPNATEESLQAMKAQQPITVLENTKNIQAVKETTTNTVAATVWNATGGTVGGVSVDKPATFIYSEEGNQFTLSVTDPTQTNQVLLLTLPQEITEIISQEQGIQQIDKQTVRVDTTNASGKTFRLTAKLAPKEATVDVVSIDVANKSLEILKKGETLAVKTVVQPENATDKTIQWKSSQSSVATVEAGKITAKKVGTTKLTATSANGKTASFTVRVTP